MPVAHTTAWLVLAAVQLVAAKAPSAIIDSVTPRSGSMGGGTRVTITGAGLAEAKDVFMGNVR